MARVFITSSSDGLGLMVGRHLVDQGHQAGLHAQKRPCWCAHLEIIRSA